jgi:2-hydroxychromene-2-carboxylate isomerase
VSGAAVTFHYDFSSPFAYLGATQIERVAAAEGARVEWKPILLGALFKQLGTADVPLTTFTPPKRAYIGRDLAHWADHWGVPYRWPSRFPMRTVAALRLAVAAGLDASAQLMAELSLALFRAYWVEDRDLADLELLRAIAREHGLPSETCERALRPDADVKEALIRNGQEALAAGVFGVPTFIVRSHIFWGQDRLELVSRTLAGWEPPGV